MIFVDTNVFMYAVGGPHPRQEPARAFLAAARRSGTPLCTSAEVVQELAHAYLPVRRHDALSRALDLIEGLGIEVWPLEYDDVTLARELHDQHPSLSSRDLCHLASCRRRGVHEMKTFDEALHAVAGIEEG